MCAVCYKTFESARTDAAMIYKRCPRCGKRIPSGTTCECYAKYKRKYKTASGIKLEYHTQRWRSLRAYVMSIYNGIDIYMLYRHGKIEAADTAHHIEPASLRPDLFYSSDNLIPVGRYGHAEIHERYKREDRAAVMEELREYQRRYRETGGG